MRDISIERAELTRYKSFIEHTVFEFSQEAGLKYVGGENRQEPTLGQNGAGKTTLFGMDAVCWCFYGSSIHGARARAPSDNTPTVTSLGYEQAEVLVAVGIDGYLYEVFRSSSPNRLAIDGELVEQEAVEALVGLSKKQFLHSVVYGQKMDTFYDLSVPNRGELFDETLKQDLWVRASERAGKLAQEIEREVSAAKTALARAEGVLLGLGDYDEMADKQLAWDSNHEAHVNLQIERLEQEERALAACLKTLETLPERVTTESLTGELRMTRDQLVGEQIKIGQLIRDIEDAEQSILFYGAHSMCPTCGQSITKAFAHKCVDDAKIRIEQSIVEQTRAERTVRARLQPKLDRLHAQIDANTLEQGKWAGQRATLIETKRNCERFIKLQQQEVERLIDMPNPYTAQLAKLIEDQESAQQAIVAQQAVVQEAEGRLILADWWKAGFKRVRLFQTRRVLDVLNLETCSIAEALGLVGWHIEFIAQTEGARPGIYISVVAAGDNAAREWSPGELQRVRLAVLLGFAALVQGYAGVYYRCEVFDEPTAWLSEQGIDNLLDYLGTRAMTLDKSIWLIDPRGLESAGFVESWQVVKEATGSVVIKGS